ncbi:P-loop containing nucleoside triphosphate hydrolase protein [Lobosporangium transversale]|uniref:p-loop containing nucleoside triphosphate hydrolase protein n=1 Tax=Lobosporangium transversale TaxID=64571 RepID=A0A1Y2H3D4_9FUNG|nr:P-loop containing nucleoside triphosphate hydrolase protein [Lobosporangium transversale]ORZ28501.1 P-loop containing nucleoside triphosphate hydrolase protein [Lobosporangium transversale]|eukprot:XP_021886186.1 P-loop containing nucleoside triphosphate hydrolase protein [Lobosporangium transversale]
MTESKKRRIIEEEEEEEIHAGHQARNGGAKALKLAKNKRSKHEESEEEREQTIDEDEEETSFREEPEGEGWVNDDEQERGLPAVVDDVTWRQRADLEFEKSKSQRGRQGTVAEMGVIEIIEMFDFMCHRHLKVPFGPKINFIIGHNGSGKSAILTAIMVCLGGKANATNRAQSLKALIREGASQTEVRLQLRNRGPDAFKPEIYGESIIIERRISKDGASGYKIKSSKGKTISTKRDELAAMCDHMNIQVDNPMNVLSQDTARQFLQSSTGEEKYKFFSRGTQLTQLSIDYEIIRECIDTMQSTLKTKTEILPELYEMAKAAQARFKDSQQAATLELKVEDLKNQVAWAQIEELEKGVKQMEKELNTLMAKIPAIEKKHAQEQAIITEIDRKIQELESNADEHASSNAPTHERKKQLEQELRAKRDELKGYQDEERTVNEEIKSLKEQIRNFDQKIEQEMKKIQKQSRRAEVEGKIQLLTEQIEASKRQLAETRENYSVLDQQVQQSNERLEQSNGAAKKIKMDLNEAKDRIRQINDQKQNSLKAFGSTVPEVLESIQEVTRRGGWRGEPPVGPLGHHVKLRDQQWAPTIESALGNVLNAFAVTTDADRNTLFGILKRHRCNSDILLTRKIIFDYSDKEPSSRFLTINRVLEFDNEWVRRLLIDKNGIESTILIEKREDADRVTSSGPHGGFPDKVTQCFTMNLMRVGDRQGGAASIMMAKYRGPPRLSQNVDQELQEHEGTIRRLEDSLRYRIRESQELLSDVENKDRERIQAKRQLSTLEKEIRLKTRAIEDLRDSLQEDEPANIQAYEESKQQALERIEAMKTQYEPIALHKQAITESMEPIRQQVMELNELIRNHESKASKIRNELDKLAMEKEEYLRRIEHWDKKLREGSEAVRIAEIELQNKSKNLEVSTEKARRYCERVKVTNTIPQLEREIKSLQERLKEQEAQRGCTLEEIAIDMKRKQDEYKSAKLAIHQLAQLVSHLKSTLHQRLSRWREFRSQMSLRSKINFSLQLSQRGYSGDLEFHHQEKSLTIRVETEDQRSGKAGIARDKDPKSLSGGEKSFSTICLLLALWDSMSSSIRCLDEFDVFMDAVNRRISMKMLIDTARESDGVQYILITPQDASSVSPGPDVRVHRLHDPERNQQTIM